MLLVLVAYTLGLDDAGATGHLAMNLGAVLMLGAFVAALLASDGMRSLPPRQQRLARSGIIVGLGGATMMGLAYVASRVL